MRKSIDAKEGIWKKMIKKSIFNKYATFVQVTIRVWKGITLSRSRIHDYNPISTGALLERFRCGRQ